MISVNTIRKARERLVQYIHPTPLLPAEWLDNFAGCPVYLKPENLQFTGSFKVRGAASLMTTLDPSATKNGVVTASSGNHGLGLAYVGNRLGVSVTVVVPESCVPSKLEGLCQLGAHVIFHGRSSIERREYAYGLAETENLVFIHSHDDPHIIAGQGSIGLEILDFLPEVGCVLVPVGGGGLIAGIASAIKELRPDITVLGVEPEIGCCMKMSLEQGAIVELPETPETIADGLRGTRPGELPFEIVQRTIDGILTVGEQTIREAVRQLHRLGKMVVEPSGAVVAAAIIENKVPFSEKPICAVLSGGNIDESILMNDILRKSDCEV